jgi:hypothetical protein
LVGGILCAKASMLLKVYCPFNWECTQFLYACACVKLQFDSVLSSFNGVMWMVACCHVRAIVLILNSWWILISFQSNCMLDKFVDSFSRYPLLQCYVYFLKTNHVLLLCRMSRPLSWFGWSYWADLSVDLTVQLHWRLAHFHIQEWDQ